MIVWIGKKYMKEIYTDILEYILKLYKSYWNYIIYT